MITHAKIHRKDSKIENDNCIIADIVELDENEFKQFSNSLLQDFDFIGQRKELMYQDTDGYHCILALGKRQNDGILIESEGYSYARYSASLPNARDFVKARIKQLADYIVSEGTEHTDNGRWSNSYEELHYHFGAEVTDTNGTGQLLCEELAQREEVAECILCEDCVEIGYHLEYCPQCQQGGIGGMMSLFSLMGCNLEDVHLCDTDEEHDLATISELNQNTLTEDGKCEWSDVLSAKVERVYTGYYGLQIGLSGADPDRLRDFSYALAGQCSAEDYDRWFKNDEPEQTEEPPFKNRKAIDLLATYEDVFRIPTEQKITNYYGDYGMHFLNYGVDDDAAEIMYNTALHRMEMDSDTFQQTEDFCYRAKILERMRACLLAGSLSENTSVVFIPPEPLGDSDTIRFESGTVINIDRENKSCIVSCGNTEMEIPLENILAERDSSCSQVCFGSKCAKPLYGMNEPMADQMLCHIQTEYDGQTEQGESPIQSM